MAKIKTITQNGKFYKLVMDDRTDPVTFNLDYVPTIKDYKVGDDIEYEVNDKGYGKLKKAAGKFPMKDYTFEKKRTALECAVRLGANKNADSKDVLIVADKFYQWLK